MTVEDLQALIEGLDWDDFQRTTDGQIHVYLPYVSKGHEDSLIKYTYRIGLHLKRPMEAIMAKGNFIRMRAAPQYENRELERLDPENLDQCLYTSYSVNLNSHSRGWKPMEQGFAPGTVFPMPQGISQAQQAQMRGMQQFQGFSGITTGGITTTGITSVPPVVDESLVYISEESSGLFGSLGGAMGSLGKAMGGLFGGTKI